MAKFGEGDSRWIVEDRADGRNVHNWHWTEKDCLEWAKKRFGELLGCVTVVEGRNSCWIRTTLVDSVEGEAYVNIRKGKIIPGYELKVRLSWEGEIHEGSSNGPVAKVEGKIELPYIADENADEEPELKVSVNDASPAGEMMRQAMLKEGKPMLLKRVAEFVKEMKAGGPAKDDKGLAAPAKAPSGTPAATGASPAGPTSGNTTTGNGGSIKPVASAKPALKAEGKKGFQTIQMTQVFHCRPQDLYDVLLDERRWMAFTQSQAKIEPRVGGSFSVFGGSVNGTYEKLERNLLIVQKWRFNSWAEGVSSNVEIQLEEPEIGTTLLKLNHTHVPEEDGFGNATVLESTERGWRDLIFQRIKAVFGYGL
eukprot:TRINITY_DN17127_c0_g1_i1.p1 TRINITY_DN17127_c0_g1~~TRINITY_DN17127_c0_g1_i1.p1  ORF type:complete len:366 (+),score=79.83 TRINITY_DN17127_c0_g1_i1:180-1277(+)